MISVGFENVEYVIETDRLTGGYGVKMVVQCAAVVGSLLYLEYGRGTAAEPTLRIVRDCLLWSAVAITLYSGYVYIVRAAKLFRQG